MTISALETTMRALDRPVDHDILLALHGALNLRYWGGREQLFKQFAAPEAQAIAPDQCEEMEGDLRAAIALLETRIFGKPTLPQREKPGETAA